MITDFNWKSSPMPSKIYILQNRLWKQLCRCAKQTCSTCSMIFFFGTCPNFSFLWYSRIWLGMRHYDSATVSYSIHVDIHIPKTHSRLRNQCQRKKIEKAKAIHCVDGSPLLKVNLFKYLGLSVYWELSINPILTRS